jgi:hypothetical protein
VSLRLLFLLALLFHNQGCRSMFSGSHAAFTKYVDFYAKTIPEAVRQTASERSALNHWLIRWFCGPEPVLKSGSLVYATRSTLGCCVVSVTDRSQNHPLESRSKGQNWFASVASCLPNRLCALSGAQMGRGGVAPPFLTSITFGVKLPSACSFIVDSFRTKK